MNILNSRQVISVSTLILVILVFMLILTILVIHMPSMGLNGSKLVKTRLLIALAILTITELILSPLLLLLS